MKLEELVSQENLDKFYEKEDPWGVKTNLWRKIRYKEILKTIENRRYSGIIDLGCGEGTITQKLQKFSQDVSGVDYSRIAIGRAKKNCPGCKFYCKSLQEIALEDLRSKELAVFLDSMVFLKRSQQEAILDTICISDVQELLVSTRIIPLHSKLHWLEHDFASTRAFQQFVSRFFPFQKSYVVQLQFNLYPNSRMKFIQYLLGILLRAISRFKAGREISLKLAQGLFAIPLTRKYVEPFVVHLCIHASCKRVPFVYEDVADEYVFRPLANILLDRIAKTNITPNQVTLLSFLLGIASAVWMITGFFWKGFISMLLLQASIIMDCLDGQLARLKKMCSEWGDIFDHTSDDIVIFLVSVVIVASLKNRNLPLIETKSCSGFRDYPCSHNMLVLLSF